jgi:hypothetical protein
VGAQHSVYGQVMELGTWPLLERLKGARHVLLAGAGGGYDVFAAVPLLTALRARGQQVSLANLSFTNLAEVRARALTPHLLEVMADTPGPDSYFPERALARWLASKGLPSRVFAFAKTGVVPLRAAWQALERELAFDAVVLVDGGTDILMRGDEAGLGTPAEDLSSVAAVDALDVPVKLVLCVGFGVDTYHGVCHAHFLENVAALSREGAYLGVAALLPGMPEADAYLQAVEHATGPASIVNLSVSAAIEGRFGDVQRTERTSNSELFINPLMSLCWGFELGAVARRCLYLPDLLDTQTAFDLALRIEAFRENTTQRPWKDLPV